MIVTSKQTRLFKIGESLFDFILEHIPTMTDESILVITSKICALAEQRVFPATQKDALIKKESDIFITTPWAFLTQVNSEWNINAGIDESNSDGNIILLPKDTFRTASLLRKKLCTHFSLKKCGVIITDTRSTPLRAGTIGRAIGFAGFLPLQSYIGKPDLFKRKSRVTMSNIADAYAAVAVACMGEGNEQKPLALMEHCESTQFINRALRTHEKNLSLDPQNDIFKAIYTYRGGQRKTR